jgi:hypothetical protein
MAPGSPEVEDHNLAPILLPTGSLAVAIFQSKFRRCLSVFRRLEFTVCRLGNRDGNKKAK